MSWDSDLGVTVRQLYAAAEDPARWPEFLKSVRDLTGAVAAGVFVQDLRRRTGLLGVQVGGSSRAVDEYHRYFAQANPWFQGGEQNSRPGTISVGLETRPLIETEYYQDFWRPQGFGPTLNAYWRNDGRSVEGLILTRETGTSFNPADMATVKELLPWMVQASQVARALARVATARDGLAAAFDRLNHGVVMLDASREVVFANAAAHEVLSEGRGLVLRRGTIAAASPCRGPSLTGLIDATLQASACGRAQGGVTSIERAGLRPVTVRVAPVPPGGRLQGLGDPVVIVFITDHEKLGAPDEEALRTAYGLSPAEARLALQLSHGLTLDQVAHGIGPGKEALRTQLKAIFDKTGAHRQQDLVRLLCGDLAVAGPPMP